MPTAEILTFAVGDAGRMIDVTVACDATDEPDEMVVFIPTGPANATPATGTITDNDATSTVPPTPDAEPGIDFGGTWRRYGDGVTRTTCGARRRLSWQQRGCGGGGARCA